MVAPRVEGLVLDIATGWATLLLFGGGLLLLRAPDAPAHRRSARVDEVAVGGGLEHVPGCSGAQRLEEELLILVHREHEDAQLGLARGELVARMFFQQRAPQL